MSNTKEPKELLKLGLNQVYDELDRDETFYCPQCKHKTLRKGSSSAGQDGWRSYVVYGCTHNMKPRTYRGKQPTGKPCDLVIAVAGRDAEISDYYDVLDELALISVPKIERWLLQNSQDIHIKGMETLYQGAYFDLVRRRSTDGLCAALYWRAQTWDQGGDTLDPHRAEFYACRSEAAEYVDFRGFNARYLLNDRVDSVPIWRKDEAEEEAVFPFKSLGKRNVAKLVRWCKAFERELPQLMLRCKQEYDRWKRESKSFWQAVIDHVGREPSRIEMLHYSGHTQTVSLRIDGTNLEESIKLRDTFGLEDVTFAALQGTISGGYYLDLETAQRVEQVTGRPFRTHMQSFLGKAFGHRYALQDVLTIAEILHPRTS